MSQSRYLETHDEKLSAVLTMLFLLLPYTANAANCKFGGQWHSNDAPQCNPQRATESKAQETDSAVSLRQQNPDLTRSETQSTALLS